jgi:hypothetical protein
MGGGSSWRESQATPAPAVRMELIQARKKCEATPGIDHSSPASHLCVDEAQFLTLIQLSQLRQNFPLTSFGMSISRNMLRGNGWRRLVDPQDKGVGARKSATNSIVLSVKPCLAIRFGPFELSS